MSYPIFVSGTAFSGKTALCLGMFGKFQEMSLKVGYFKPVGQVQKVVEGKPCDPDVVLMKEIMGLEDEIDVLCPVVLDRRYLDDVPRDCNKMKEKINNSYEALTDDKDVLLIESAPRPEFLSCCGLDVGNLAKQFNAKILFSVRGNDDSVAEKSLLYKEFITNRGGKMLGVILNFVPYQQLERMKGIISPLLEKYNLNVLGIIPDERELTLPTVEDVRNVLDAEVLAGEDKLDDLVDNYLVGAMTPESALSWLRRSVGKAFITGGDRTDLILTALEANPSAIILTGNIYPSVRVLMTAQEKDIPVLLVSDDTYSTVSKLDLLDGRIVPSPTSTKKIQLTQKVIGEYVDWKKILDDYVDWKQSCRENI
ncbi:MAG: phosphotransacetylase family protein [Candidatus Bathyarchaeia archaeon]